MKDRLLVPRVGEPEDVAAAISFLLSDDASFITGRAAPGRRGVADAMTRSTLAIWSRGFRTVVVTSADVTGRLVGKRCPPDVFRRVRPRGRPAQLVRPRLGRRPVARTRPGVHGASHRVARRPARPGPRDAAAGRLARAHRDLRRRLRRDGFGRARAGGAADDPSAAGRAARRRRPHPAGGERARVRAVPRHLRRGPDERLRDARPDHARAGRLHDPGGRPVRGLLLGRAGARSRPPSSARGRARSSGASASGRSTSSTATRSRWPTATCCSSSRCATLAAERRDGGHVHGAAVRRHDRLVVPPAPVARRRRRPQRLPRRGGRRRRSRPTLRHAIGGVLAARARAHALLRAHRELVPADDERRVLGQRPVVGVRQPDGLVPRAHRVARVDAARVARARRRRRPVPRDRGAARVGAPTGSRRRPTPASR